MADKEQEAALEAAHEKYHKAWEASAKLRVAADATRVSAIPGSPLVKVQTKIGCITAGFADIMQHFIQAEQKRGPDMANWSSDQVARVADAVEGTLKKMPELVRLLDELGKKPTA